MYLEGINGAELDRWITGNYGEDAITNDEECEECGKFKEDCSCQRVSDQEPVEDWEWEL